jgi:hypothetical protein
MCREGRQSVWPFVKHIQFDVALGKSEEILRQYSDELNL